MAARKAIKKGCYAGKFIATESFNRKTVVACGNDPIKVRDKAVKDGCSSPVVVYVPDEKMYNIY